MTHDSLDRISLNENFSFQTSRRTMRSRPDDYSNVNNSVNPSPKKQPRLNLQSPNEARWSVISNTQSTSTDESMCKRYKLEDQLSDIQFIDCSTPEHTMQNPNTIYASVQIHNAPSSSHSSELNEIDQKYDKETKFGLNRNSYPETKYNESVPLDRSKEERFSYPGMGRKFTDEKKFVCRVPVNEDVATKKTSKVGRFSYCDPNSISNVVNKEPVAAINLILRSCSAELSKQNEIQRSNEMQRSKLSIATPSSPSRSPRYSLLVGDTSSENSSSLNTPVFDMDISTGNGLMNNSEADKMDGDSKRTTDSYDAKEFSTLLSEDSSSHVSEFRFVCARIVPISHISDVTDYYHRKSYKSSQRHPKHGIVETGTFSRSGRFQNVGRRYVTVIVEQTNHQHTINTKHSQLYAHIR